MRRQAGEGKEGVAASRSALVEGKQRDGWREGGRERERERDQEKGKKRQKQKEKNKTNGT